MSFFSPKVLPPSTIEELEARAELNFNNPWFSSRMPWIHVMSLASNCQPTSGNSQINKGIFTSKRTNEAYSVTLEDGTVVSAPSYIVSQTGRPNPAVVGIDVKKQGELGSTKRATIKIQAFTDEQFNEIAKCYFIPGMSVRAQWGWNLSAKGTKGVSPITEVLFDTDAIKKILDQQKINPNYDGLQGRVVSYGANLADNHIWEITIDIVAAGSMLADVKANDYSNGCVCEEEVPQKGGDQTKTEKITTKVSNLDAVLLGIAKQETTVAQLVKNYGADATSYCYQYYGYPMDENGTEDTSNILGVFDNAQFRYENYISLKLLQQIVSKSVTVALGAKKTFKFDSTNSNLTRPQGSKDGKGPQQIFSCDPRIAIIPGSSEYTPDFQAGFANGSLDAPPSAYNSDGTINLNNILVCAKYTRKVLKGMEEGNDSVLDYMTKVVEDINRACGNPWEFAFVDSTNDLLDDGKTETQLSDANAVITIIDTKAITKSPPQPYAFHASPSKSNVINIGIDLKLSEAMKTQAVYAGGGGQSATKQPCNDRFNIFQQFSGDNLGVPKSPATKPAADCGTNNGSCGSEEEKGETYSKRLSKLKWQVEDKTVEAVYGDLVELNTVKSASDPCAGSILPVEFSVKLDGIGGLKFGQLVTCDRFPTGYTKFMHHQIIGVEHNIDMSGWITTIKTVGRYKK